MTTAASRRLLGLSYSCQQQMGRPVNSTLKLFTKVLRENVTHGWVRVNVFYESV